MRWVQTIRTEMHIHSLKRQQEKYKLDRHAELEVAVELLRTGRLRTPPGASWRLRWHIWRFNAWAVGDLEWLISEIVRTDATAQAASAQEPGT